MSGKRATDHLEPSAKKRGSDRQITKDDDDSQSGEELGASSNPFAGIQLAPSAAQPTTDAIPAKDGAEDAAQEGKNPEGEPDKAEEPESAAQPETAAPAPATAAESPVKNPLFSGGFGSLAGGTQPGSGLSLFGSSTTGTGGFGSLAANSSGPVFSFGAAASASSSATDAAAAATPLFTFFGAPSSAASAAAAPAATNGDEPSGTKASLPPEAPVTTGEEDEETVFTGEGTLYEFDETRKWRERGTGEMRLNVLPESRQARLIMRQRGNLRLLVNANLWREMPVSKMDGGKGVTFAVANAVVPEEKPGEAGADAAGADKRLCTFALRIKNPDVLSGFLLALQTHKQEQAEVKEGGEA